MDKKSSSLSADAAEFVPLRVNNTTAPHKPRHPNRKQERWKSGNPMEINKVPRYLTNCYPFVPSDAPKFRSEAPRFQAPFPYPGNVAAVAPLRFPPWPAIPQDYVVPPHLNLALNHLPGQGLFLGTTPDPNSSWAAPPNMYMHHQQIRQHYPAQSQVYLATQAQPPAGSASAAGSGDSLARQTPKTGVGTDAVVSALSTSEAAMSVSSVSTSMITTVTQSALHQKTANTNLRPASPIMISRSAQTDFPASIKNLTVKEKLCALFSGGRSRSVHSAQRYKSSDQDSDSGYSSPLHQPNYVSIGTQVEPSNLSVSEAPSAADGCHLSKSQPKVNESHVRGPKYDEGLRQEGQRKKKKRQNREQRDAGRGTLGSNTKMLSRSSSSISSSGTKPEEDDDEKIDLHSWTDFPPVSPRIAAPSSSRPSNQPVTLTIERSAHEPPWSLKFSSVDKSRSAAGDKQPSTSVDCKRPAQKPSNQSPRRDSQPDKTVQISVSNCQSEGKKTAGFGDSKNKHPFLVKDEALSNGNCALSAATATPITRLVTTTTHSPALMATSAPAMTVTASACPPVSSTVTAAPNRVYNPQLSGAESHNYDPRNKGHLNVSPQTPVLPAFQSDPPYRSYANIAQGIILPPSNAYPIPSHPPPPHYQNGLFPPPGYPSMPAQPLVFYPGGALSQPPPAIVQFEAQQAPPFFAPDAMAAMSYAAQLKASACDSRVVLPIPSSRGKPWPSSSPGGARLGTQLSDSRIPADEPAGQPVDGFMQTVDGEEKKKRRRRRRGAKSKQNGDADGEGDNDLILSQTVSSDTTLHFEDVDEFPDLVSSRGGHEDVWAVNERSTLSGTSLSYSDIIKSSFSKAGSQSRPQSLTGSGVSEDDGGGNDDGSGSRAGTSSESKRARKRRKRREQANKAAEAELAEISLEQQWLKEMGLKKAVGLSGKSGIITDAAVVSEAKKAVAAKGGKKSQQPIAIDIAAMIDAIQKKPPPQQTATPAVKQSPIAAKGSKKERPLPPGSGLPGNMLDSSAPVQKRGKEREAGKPKKPSPLKKVILKEREQRKRLRLLDEDPDTANLDSVGAPGVGIVGGESELSQDALSDKSEDTDGGNVSGAAELSADLSPISQTSPISMSPASPGNSGVNSPVTGSIGRDPVLMKIHSRRFREYCTQILDKEIDQCCASLLQDLVKFQDRMYHKDPVKAKSKRRVVLGLREVTKHLKLKKIKCVVISPNLEKIQSKGGLDEALNTILNMCQEQGVPFVFALGRCALGRACAKLVPVSVVGIFNYEGCELKYNSLISLTSAARAAYHDMVLAVEKEVSEYPASQASSIAGVPGLFAAHMGHSRTPSGCSAISFTSSILSEPISENFPHAEPEVDSKGYEIVRDAAGNVVHPPTGHDIDDGNEADIEDFGEKKRKKKIGRNTNCVRFGDLGNQEDGRELSGKDGEVDNNDNNCGRLSRNVSESTLTQDEVSLRGQLGNAQDARNESKSFNDAEKCRRDVEHIDSIHSDSYSLVQEILLSQHASLPGEQRSRPQSAGGSPRPSPLSPSSLSAVCGSDIRQARQGNGEADDYLEEEEDDNAEEVDDSKSHHRIIDKERIKNWLESQTNISTED